MRHLVSSVNDEGKKQSFALCRVQEQIAEKQKESLSYQRELAANGSMLSQALDASRASVREMLAGMQFNSIKIIWVIF